MKFLIVYYSIKIKKFAKFDFQEVPPSMLSAYLLEVISVGKTFRIRYSQDFPLRSEYK